MHTLISKSFPHTLWYLILSFVCKLSRKERKREFSTYPHTYYYNIYIPYTLIYNNEVEKNVGKIEVLSDF